MKKSLLLAGTFALLTLPALAQTTGEQGAERKWDGMLNALIEGQAQQQFTLKSVRTVTADSVLSVSASVTNADEVSDFIQKAGYEATVITRNLVVTDIPAHFIPTLAQREDVVYIKSSRQFRPLMNKIRTEIGVTNIHNGTGLETPFTGKGVVVGVIDQGFQYDHPAFTNRVKKYGLTAVSGNLTDKMPARDPKDDNGHATHVTNIAAGNKVAGTDYYGVATGSDLILISSDFRSNSVLKQAKAIKDYAEAEGKPWVINMSFGGVMGPHDASTEYDTGMSDLCGPGGLMVAAMGNEGGQNLHARRKITDPAQPVYLCVKPRPENQQQVIISELWGESTDGTERLTIKPIVVSRGQIREVTKFELSKAGFTTDSGIDKFNNRQFFKVQGFLPNLLKTLSITGNGTFCWKVEGGAGDGFHAWVDGVSYPASFEAHNEGEVKAEKGDDEYLVGEGAASIGKAVAVASYNAADRYTTLNGQMVNLAGWLGYAREMSKFSSKGPHLVDNLKPMIAAPGGVVISAYSKNAGDFASSTSSLVKDVIINGQKNYYSVMSGTSMASPVVTGVVALWLEANPKLTFEQLTQIFKETGRRNTAQTGQTDERGWNNWSGFGKIDAYAGLKKALELANQSGINDVINTEAPVSIQKEDNAWKVLFNNDETFADLQVYAVNGRLVKSMHLNAPRRGSEQVIDLTGMEPGVYLFRVATTASQTTRKMMVK